MKIDEGSIPFGIAIMAQARYIFEHSRANYGYTMYCAVKDAEVDYVRINKIWEDAQNEQKENTTNG